MTVRERLSMGEEATGRDAGAWSRADLGEPADPGEAAGGLAEADRLIADLAALVDAGLVVVHEHVLGPARYGAACGVRDGREAGPQRATGSVRA